MIVLDTHAWVWWLSDPGQLSDAAARAITEAASEGELRVSTISVWEVALLVRKGRLVLTHDVIEWVRAAEAVESVEFIPVTNPLALRAVGLEGLHDDPADRIVVATALALGAPVVTKDRRIHAFEGVEAIW